MNPAAPLSHWQQDRLQLVWLNPARYSVLERMYLAARVTRSYLAPDAILNRAESHLNEWHAALFADGSEASRAVAREVWERRPLEARMEAWLEAEIAAQRHDSVLEFAGMEYTLWIGGCSLGTIRDVDRHRRFSYEELTTRHPAFFLKTKQERLDLILRKWDAAYAHWEATQAGDLPAYKAERNRAQGVLPLSEREFLLDLFYVHPKRGTNRGWANVDRYLVDCARGLAGYLKDCDGEAAHGWDGDDARGRLPLALRTPFLMAGNQRDWFEAGGKRTCFHCGHWEYVTLFRGVVELLGPAAPFLSSGVSRWCPMGKPAAACCRTAWVNRLRPTGRELAVV